MYFLAIRHLVSRRKQTFLTLLGIVFGTGAYIIISGMMLGFRYYIVDQLVNNDAHIRISVREEFLKEHSLDSEFFGTDSRIFWNSPPSGRKDDVRIENPEGWFRRLRMDPRVVGFSPQLTAQAIVSVAKASTTANLIGCDPAQQVKVTNIKKYITQGRFEEIAGGGNRIVAGEGVLLKIGAKVDDRVLLSTGRGEPIPFKLVGAFRVGVKALDDSTIYADLNDVQKINHTPSKVTDIAVRLTEAPMAREVANSWAATTHEKVQSWDEINANFFSVFRIQDFTRYMMTLSILLVAGFGIYNTLNMVVTQKRQEIAILRSIGYEARDVLQLFLVQGVILGFAGGVIGIIIGYLVCFRMQFIRFGGGPMGSGTGYMMISFDPGIYVSGLFLAVFSSILASFLPARSAGRMEPIEIIRAGAE